MSGELKMFAIILAVWCLIIWVFPNPLVKIAMILIALIWIAEFISGLT
jgi:hypothetical protein